MDELLKVVDAQAWTSDRKGDAKGLWSEARSFSEFRNVIAHSPVTMNRNHPGVYGIVDIQCLKGSHDRYHRMYFADGIYSSAVKVQKLASDLSIFWKVES